MIWLWLARLLGAASSPIVAATGANAAAPGPAETYALPRSRREQARLELQHFALRQLLGTHFLAPIEQPGAILDVGSGTGVWLREAARRWPRAQLVALDKDLTLLRQPLPPHCQPVQADLLTGLPFAEARFDYVHQRFLATAIPVTAWPGILDDLLRITRPGGWLELVEATGDTGNEGPLHRQVRTWFTTLLERRGLRLDAALNLPHWLQERGLQPQILRFQMPLFGRRRGAPLFREDVLSALQALESQLAAVNHIPREQIAATLTALPREWERLRTSSGGIAVWGRKP
ncbi:MAG: methyltransferase domain-containing protein [Thermogemmatispora sp.]|uniref:class I SAM-dependent methyltransferase n=1 Tax=Thermogemmatispora sp. TaxID=1968838 RepID=UPI00260ECA6A|nr:class I SAM-dependent methyltransferase [Thermogemmatispora sp.]MBX5458726.1 methyltransferase domain-containing protein [Thermogemmatispora sp.]